MATLPKIDSKGLRLAKSEGARRVSSVVNVRLQPCKHEWSAWKIIGRTGDWFHPHIVERTCSKCRYSESDEH